MPDEPPFESDELSPETEHPLTAGECRLAASEHRFVADERGVSIPLTHALTFGITAVLVLALLTSAGTFLTAQEERVGENQFGDIGSDVVSHVNSFDRLNGSAEGVTASVEPNYPDRVLGQTYTIRIGPDERDVYDGVDYTIQIESGLLDRTLYYPLRNSTRLDVGASAPSTSPVICLRDDEITMGEGCE